MRTTILLLLVLLSPLRVFADERWYILSIAGTPVGWVEERIDGTETRTTMSARLARLGKQITMRFDTITTEDGDGALQTLVFEALLSKQPQRVEVHVDADRIRIMAPPHVRTVERGPDQILGPVAVSRLTAGRLWMPGDQIEYTVFSPELQRLAKVRRVLIALSERTPCESAAAKRVEESIEGIPARRTIWLDADSATAGDSIPSPFGPMSTCRAPKETALSAGGELPADLYERTLARSNVRFADPSRIDRMVVRVRPRDASQPLPVFTAHNQRIVAPGLVEITRPIRSGSPAGAAPDREFVEPNALVESTNADVVRIAKASTKGDAYETALALTKWTAENLTMDAGIVMAPASELVRDRRATCMGYATLLAALARAAGLPSRVVMGYVYYGGIWGGHAWTEMFVDGRWLPFDAAVFAPGVASAARLSVGASSLADGGGSLTGPLMALFGRVEIDCVEYERDGHVIRVSGTERPFHVAPALYESRGLGLRIGADGWIIERAASIWPSTLVVAFRRGSTSVELHQRPRYPQRPLAVEGDAMFTSVDGGTLWVWTARGPDAGTALQALLNRVERVR